MSHCMWNLWKGSFTAWAVLWISVVDDWNWRLLMKVSPTLTSIRIVKCSACALQEIVVGVEV